MNFFFKFPSVEVTRNNSFRIWSLKRWIVDHKWKDHKDSYGNILDIDESFDRTMAIIDPCPLNFGIVDLIITGKLI